MATATIAFTSWSFTRWNDWQKCPAFACYRHLKKVKTEAMLAREKGLADGTVEPGPMERGADIAKKAEDFLKGKVKAVPMPLMPVAQVYRDLRKRGNLSVEDNWGFDKDWIPCSPTDWNKCWLRVKIDVAYMQEGTKKAPGDIFHMKDNKTGKYDERKVEEYKCQLELYGVAGLSRMPTVTSVTAQLVYSDLGILYPADAPIVFPREQLEGLRKIWTNRVRPMFADRRFSPRPGYYCRYCEFSKTKGGPCKY